MVDLEFAKTDRFLGPDAPAAKAVAGAAPEHRISLSYAAPGKQPVTIELFKAEGADDKYMVKRSGSPTVYRVAKSAFNSMTPGKAPEGAVDGPADGGEGDEDGGLTLPPDGGKSSGLGGGDAAQGAG
jgi:hypothetical protein